MMATTGEKHERLHDFLVGSFKPPEPESFLKLKGFEKVAQTVNRNVGDTEYFYNIIQALDHRGLIDAHFFDRLAKERPRKGKDVRDLRAVWIDENQAHLIEELAKQLKSATTLFDLVCCIGKAVVQAGYEECQANRVCSQYLGRYKQQYGRVKILGMVEPIE